MRLDVFPTEGVNVKNAYIGDTCASNTYARCICTKNNFFAIDAYIKNASPENIPPEGASTKSICSKDGGTIEHSRIHLIFFSILKMGSTGLEILVRTNYIKSTCVGSAGTLKPSRIHL